MTQATILAEPDTASADSIDELLSNSQNSVPSNAPEDESARLTRLAKLVLNDFLVTQLLSRGKPIKSSEVPAAAENFTTTRAGLKAALSDSALVEFEDRSWELSLRVRGHQIPREERARAPLESTLKSFTREIGKPLPLPIIVREITPLRGTRGENVQQLVAQNLQHARWAVEVRPKTYLPASLLLDSAAPNAELIIRANALESDRDFVAVQNRDFQLSGDLAARAQQVLEACERPLSLRVLGYALWKNDVSTFDARELAAVVADKKRFHIFVGGIVATQKQMSALRSLAEDWMQEMGGSAAHIDVAQALRQRLKSDEIIAPTTAQLSEIANFATQSGSVFSVDQVLMDVLEIEPDDANFIALLQGTNDALRANREYLPSGIGRFLLRASVPEEVGQVPAALQPVHLSVRDSQSNELLDIEMSDEGLEGDAVEFVHDPQWEDINEEVEVKLGRRDEQVEAETSIIVLNHHYEQGTLKLRRMDEDFFAVQAALSRLNLRAQTENDSGESKTQSVTAWASRDSGLIYGLGDWYRDKLPASGGVLRFERDPQASLNAPFSLTIEKPDSATFIDAARLEELMELRESAKVLSLFELLQSVMEDHQTGATLPTLWAEINVVRRTTKRLLCSVLSAYGCYSFKQRGPHHFQWRFDAARLDSGFKRNKRKFVRK